MKRIALGTWLVGAAIALALGVGTTGCAVGVGYDEPEWDGGLGYDDAYAPNDPYYEYPGYGGIGVYGIYTQGHDRDRGMHAFHPDGGGREGDRGRASMGGRTFGRTDQARRDYSAQIHGLGGGGGHGGGHGGGAGGR